MGYRFGKGYDKREIETFIVEKKKRLDPLSVVLNLSKYKGRYNYLL
jgi:hypothetical protein